MKFKILFSILVLIITSLFTGFSANAEQGKWTPPIDLNGQPSWFNFHPSIATDSMGNTHVVYASQCCGQFNTPAILYQEKLSGQSSFSSPIPVQGSFVGDAPRIAIGTNNHIYVVWAFGYVPVGIGSLYFHEGIIGTNGTVDWQVHPAEQIAEGYKGAIGYKILTDNYGGGPSVATDLSGDVFLTTDTFDLNDSKQGTPLFIRRSGQSSWAYNESPNHRQNKHETSRIALLQTDVHTVYIHIAFTSDNTSGSCQACDEIYYSRATVDPTTGGVSWQVDEQNISNSPGSWSAFDDIALNPKTGNVLVSWAEGNANLNISGYMYPELAEIDYKGSGIWTEPQLYHVPGSAVSPVWSTSLTSGNGVMYVAWSSDGGAGQKNIYTAVDCAGTWGTISRLTVNDTSSKGAAWQPSLGMAGNNGASLVWLEQNTQSLQGYHLYSSTTDNPCAIAGPVTATPIVIATDIPTGTPLSTIAVNTPTVVASTTALPTKTSLPTTTIALSPTPFSTSVPVSTTISGGTITITLYISITIVIAPNGVYTATVKTE